MSEGRIRPILKWPGGKFRLLDFILPELPEGKRLVEPFAGSGAVFMNTRYRSYLLADLNHDLIRFFETLAARGEDFIDECRRLFSPEANQAEVFYERRERFNSLPSGAKERAALFLYFNRHGYNGLIRYNAKGGFNVPFGRYAKPRFPDKEMRAFLERSRTAKIEFRIGDFRDTFRSVRKGDVVYCDPPYIPLSATANFTSYAGNSFGATEQAGLAEAAENALAKGARVVMSNHDSEYARSLYRGASYMKDAEVRRFISCNGKKRDMVRELLAVYA